MFLITFHTNFDANSFCRKTKEYGTSKMKPVPRKLSSSCGTCVIFTPKKNDEFDFEYLFDLPFEKIYRINGDDYLLLSEKE